ncbi:MAG: hypothetical protein EOL92_10430 [Bacteroidia bacterium]|nr:hypothetical protein [Bacteroidia bacterium]
MKRVSLLLIFMTAVAAYAGNLTTAAYEFPDIAPWDYRPDLAAKVANRFITADNTEAIRALESASEKMIPPLKSYIANERLCHIIRLIFVPNSSTTLLRPPGLGSPGMIPYHSMQASEWPYIPFVVVDDIPLSMSNGWEGDGMPESAAKYLKYFTSNGTIRTTPFHTPTSDDVAQALGKLFRSTKWNALKWKDSGQNWRYEKDEGWAIQQMYKQSYNCEQSGPECLLRGK